MQHQAVNASPSGLQDDAFVRGLGAAPGEAAAAAAATGADAALSVSMDFVELIMDLMFEITLNAETEHLTVSIPSCCCSCCCLLLFAADAALLAAGAAAAERVAVGRSCFSCCSLLHGLFSSLLLLMDVLLLLLLHLLLLLLLVVWFRVVPGLHPFLRPLNRDSSFCSKEQPT